MSKLKLKVGDRVYFTQAVYLPEYLEANERGIYIAIVDERDTTLPYRIKYEGGPLTKKFSKWVPAHYLISYNEYLIKKELGLL